MSCILALDQGTTSSRALLFDLNGQVLGIGQQEFPQIYPQPGWVEHDPQILRDTQFECVQRALAAASRSAHEISAIGITNQRETTILWDRRSGEPIANALVWQDRRTAALCKARCGGDAEALIRERTGLLLDAYFSASKIRWLLDQDSRLQTRAERGELAFGTVDSWLIWHLTAGRLHLTDATNASRTLLYDIERGDWSDELLALWNIPRAVLPQVVDSSGVCATTSIFGPEIPIAGVAGDQQAALFAQACFTPGMAKCTYGTGCFILMATGRQRPRSTRGLVTTVATRINGVTEYAIEGSVFMGGAIVQWLRDGLGIVTHAADIETLAASVVNSDGVILVPAFTGLGAPHWDPAARALLIGMTRGTTRAHIARAALDAIAWQVADVCAAMTADAALPLRELRVDGGASANHLLMQIQADVLGVPIVRPRNQECTAFGAAQLAALGIGLYRNRDELAAAWQAEARFTPQVQAADIAARHHDWQRAIARARDWVQ